MISAAVIGGEVGAVAIKFFADSEGDALTHPAFAGGGHSAVFFAEAGVAVNTALFSALRTQAALHALFTPRLFGDRVAHGRVCTRTARRFDCVRVDAAQAEPAAIVAARDDAAALWRRTVDERCARAHDFRLNPVR